jgi:hypothetical protein
MSQKETIRRILKEELGNTKSNFEKQAKLIVQSALQPQTFGFKTGG